MDHLDPIAQSNQEDSLKRPDAEIRSLSFRDNPTLLGECSLSSSALKTALMAQSLKDLEATSAPSSNIDYYRSHLLGSDSCTPSFLTAQPTR